MGHLDPTVMQIFLTGCSFNLFSSKEYDQNDPIKEDLLIPPEIEFIRVAPWPLKIRARFVRHLINCVESNFN
jgi:hypothetical protein